MFAGGSKVVVSSGNQGQKSGSRHENEVSSRWSILTCSQHYFLHSYWTVISLK